MSNEGVKIKMKKFKFNQIYEWIIYNYNYNIVNYLPCIKKKIWIHCNRHFGINILPNQILPLLIILKNHSINRYTQLSDIIVTDYPKNKLRFTIKYVLISFNFSQRLVISLQIDELMNVESVTPLFLSAISSEREIWDLFGIFFKNHKNLRRILTDYGFKGHPLRKSFPLSGFEETNYDYSKNKLKYPQIGLSQELRGSKFFI